MASFSFGGLASGIDSAALIDSIIKAKESSNTVRRNDITHLNGENDSLDELNTKLLALNDVVDKLRSINGGGINKQVNSSDSAVASAVAGSGASNTSTSLNVASLANAATASFNDPYSSLTQALAPHATGTQKIGIDVGTGSNLVSVDIDITASTTVEQFVNSFNANDSAKGRVSASAVNVGTQASPSYKVVFTTLESGTDKGSIAFDIANAATGFGGNTDLQNKTLDQATNAEFSLGGISGTISRSSNTVSDVIPGITFELKDTASTTLTVSDDADASFGSITKLVDAYNSVVNYIKENDLVVVKQGDSGSKNYYGALAKTQLDEDLLNQFRFSLSGASSENGTSVKALSQMGISTERDGTLSLDEDKFRAAVAEDSLGAGEVLRSLADDLGGPTGIILGYTKYNGRIDLAQKGNNNEIDMLNDAITNLERSSEQTRTMLSGVFSRLEGTSSQLQSQQSALTAILAAM